MFVLNLTNCKCDLLAMIDLSLLSCLLRKVLNDVQNPMDKMLWTWVIVV